MSKHAIIIIKNKNNEYLQYFDSRWNSFLFPNCKMRAKDDITSITNYINEILNKKNFKYEFLGKKTHTKYSVSAGIEKEYTHYFYKVDLDIISMKDNFKWFALMN